MTLTTNSEPDLLAALYDGPFEQPLWSTFLDLLRARFRANYAGLIFRPPDHPANMMIELFSGERARPELHQLYEAEMYKQDPVPYFHLREGRVYALSELFDLDNPSHSAFYHGLLVPSGMTWARTVRITEATGVSAWLSVGREKPDFTASDGAFLSALAPHVRRALRSYVAIEREKFRANVTGDAIQRLNFGWISLDGAGRIVEASPPADRLLQHGTAIRRGRYGRLVAVSPTSDRELSAAIKACASNPAGRPRALHLSRDPWIDILLVPVQNRSASAAPTPVAIAYIQGDNRSAADRHEQIAELFGLLPSEARLALALSRGLSITEAAADLGLTAETARNYSKKIYAKTGARGQADLIRFILASVLALA